MPKPRGDPLSNITSKQLEEWTSSFDKLLASEQGVQLFLEHLTVDGNERYLEFWLRCRRLADDQRRLQDEAAAIFDTFLEIDAPLKVDVSREAEAARAALEARQAENCDVFEGAQHRARVRMEQNFYPDFCDHLLRLRRDWK